MISMIHPLPSGNALRLYLRPPADAVQWKVLRKGSDSISGHDDTSALLVYRGDERVFVEAAASLANDTPWFYQAFYSADGQAWSASPAVIGTPSASYVDMTTDVMGDLRHRIESGLLVECQRGTFGSDVSRIAVYSASPAFDQGLQFPLVTLHLEGEDPQIRSIGESVPSDGFGALDFDWGDSEGWLSNVRIGVAGWCLNSDMRLELRKALRRVILANLPVFASFGWIQPSFSQQDMDMISGEYPANIYQSIGSFSCIAPAVVASAPASVIRDVVSVTDAVYPPFVTA